MFLHNPFTTSMHIYLHTSTAQCSAVQYTCRLMHRHTYTQSMCFTHDHACMNEHGHPCNARMQARCRKQTKKHDAYGSSVFGLGYWGWAQCFVFPQSTPRPLPLSPQASTGPATLPSLPATLASVSCCPMSVMALTTAAIIPMKNFVVGFLSVCCSFHKLFSIGRSLDKLHSAVQEEGHLTNCPVCEGHVTLSPVWEGH